MTINWWTLGLQAVNVLILIWLLSRVFWRPVAKAIATRQDAVQKMLRDAETTQAVADAAHAEIMTTRAQMATERQTLLAEAKKTAATDAKAVLAEAAQKAETVLQAAQKERERDTAAARAKAAADAAGLAVDIARKLLARVDTSPVQSTFLNLLVEAIEQMAPKDRTALLKTAGGIDLVSAVDLDDDAKAILTKAVGKALGGAPKFNFLTDPDLVAGFEIRTAHFVLRDSWQSDLAAILKDLHHAA
jgi:F-type H+-transporting ATPase subunit b